jgi:hypothetical protein
MEKCKYFLVKCKHGHVGRNKYLPLVIPVCASDKKQAASLAKSKGGVKRDHRDWCLETPIEVQYEAYVDAVEIYFSDIYWNKKTRSNLELFESRLIEEKNYYRKNGIKTNKQNFFKRVKDYSPWFLEKKRNQQLM